MKHIITIIASAITLQAFGQSTDKLIQQKDVEQTISTLAADSMQGRGNFSPGIEKAAQYIEHRFQDAGLKSFSTQAGYRQSFDVTRSVPLEVTISLNGSSVPVQNSIIVSNGTFAWDDNKDVQIVRIKPGRVFLDEYFSILRTNKNALVLVDSQYSSFFNHFREAQAKGSMTLKRENQSAQVFILENATTVNSFRVNYKDNAKEFSLNNIVGVLPGKTKPNEYVIFSAHYDHLGILKPMQGDSIANGADDDASGVTGVITLAKYFKKLNNNARTLIFVAFTAEEIGEYGSQYFATQLNPDKVVAMFNMELIGSESKFGKNAAFLTGFDRSDLGSILQRNLAGSSFKIYPDPYLKFDLFYRSDNASLAHLGVPAHTISTAPIDKDQFYHTVKDEVTTLDLNGLTATIRAIATGANSIVNGLDTPTRVKK
jgi:hypothetical protein